MKFPTFVGGSMKSFAMILRGVAPLVLFCAAAPAQNTVTLSPIHDAYVNDSAPADTFNNAFLVVGKSTQEFLPRYRSFLRFNLASIPAGAVITNATLRLNLQSFEGSGTQAIEVHRALATWSSTTIAWNNQPAFNGSVEVSRSPGTSVGSWYNFPIPALVQAWVDGTFPNHGAVFSAAGETTAAKTRTFASGGASDPSIRPELEITYVTAPEIQVTPASLAFGSQTVGTTSAAQVLRVKNEGNAALNFSSVSSTSAQFVVAGGPALPTSLAPGVESAFDVRFRPASSGPQTAGIKISSDDADEPVVTVACSGTGTAPEIQVTPASFAFGNQTVGTTSAAQVLRVKNEGNAALNLSSVSSTSAQFVVTSGPPLPTSLAPGVEAAFDVRFRPASSGPQTAGIKISSDDADEPVVTVPCSGTGTEAPAPDIAVSPGELHFGKVMLGKTSSAQNVKVENLGDAPLAIHAVAASNPQFHLANPPPLPLSLGKGASALLEVFFRPEVEAVHNALLSIQSDDADEPRVTVSLVGEGIPPEPPPPDGRGNFQRGDANDSGATDISDVVSILGCLFLGGACPGCSDAADANDDGEVNITDPIAVLGYLFLGSRQPPAPFECGLDPTPDPLDCETFRHCPQGPGIIRDVLLDKNEVCPGESLKVTVVAEHPDGEGKPVEVSVNGKKGREQHLQFRGVPGPRRIFVAATTAEGHIDTREVAVDVRKCDPAGWIPDVRVGSNPFRLRTVDFIITNVSDLPMGAERYVWAFGDGKVEETSVPYASHRYAYPSLIRDEPYTVFQATITVKPKGRPEASAPKTMTVYNTYALDKQSGRIRPPAEWDERMETIGPYLVGRFALTNLEDEPITFTTRRIVEQPCSPAQDPRAEAVPKEISLYLGSGERFESAIVLPLASVPPDICGIAVHFTGSTRSGSPAYASLYFGVRQNPFLTEPERDYDVLQTLNSVAGLRLIADTNRINDEQLYRLAHEDRIQFPVRGRFELGGGGEHLPDPDLGEECTPGRPLRDGLTCAATAEWMVVHGFIANARKGELVLSPACGMIGAMLKEIPDPQLFSHVGIMTAHGVEIAHSTASEERIADHKIEIEGPFGLRVPAGGVDPTVLQFAWPGALVQSVEDAFRGKLLRDPNDKGYTVGSFAWGPVSCNGDETLISPRIVKPSRDTEDAVTQTLHDAAEEARRIVRDEGTHYRFFAYTEADLREEDACADPPHAYCRTLCDRCIATMCSSFVWRSFKNIGVDLAEPEDAGDPNDGLFSYDEEARRAAANFLYAKIHNDVQDQADDIEDLIVDWLLVARRTANQVVNCFADDDCDDFESTDWADPGTGLTVSPDDTQRWDRVYGETEDMVFRPAQWVRVHRVASTQGSGRVRGLVLDLEGNPVEDAEVSIDIHGVAAESTDGDGRFQFDSIPTGLRQIRATKEIGGERHESCTVGADFNPPADDCGLVDVRGPETVAADLVLGPPPASLRCVTIRIDGRLTDHDFESPSEHGDHEDFGTVHLAPVFHIHEDLGRHDHGQGTVSFRSSCVDDELYVKLDFDVSIVDDNAVHVEVRVRLYEGASCATDDKDTDRTFDLGVIDAGATVTPPDVRVENEDEGDDLARYTITISNLPSDDCR